MSLVPDIRILPLNSEPITPHGSYVLYWMIASRRFESNFALDRAVELATELRRPLVVLEALRLGYPWASDRMHQWIIDGMKEHAEAALKLPITYYPFIERTIDEGKGLLSAFASNACAVVTDYFPCFMFPSMVQAASRQVRVRFEQVDSNGLLPVRAADRTFSAAVECRRFLQRNLRHHLDRFPQPHPLRSANLIRLDSLPAEISNRWPRADFSEPRGSLLLNLPIDHSVKITSLEGGEASASRVLKGFVEKKLSRYGEDRNHPDLDGGSGLSPYLHFGHISTHQIFRALTHGTNWSISSMKEGASGKRHGWWGLDESREGFLDELVTWREIGFNMASRESKYDSFDSLPAWARKTLDEHRKDPRTYLYTLEQFEGALTHDPLWNAAQRQIVHEGRMHNYLRMLWGKKILEWTRDPEEAIQVMIHLNNKYGLDGRDPNSYTGIFWVLGRYDRPWPPERKVFGIIRYMSSENTARKLDLKRYLARWSQQTLF